jgi:hypothetical protein
VFKIILFLYWDLEHYLESIDYEKYILKTNVKNLNCLKIIFNKDIISYDEYINILKKRKVINF